MPPQEVDVNVFTPAKTEVRFRQLRLVHDFIRDTIRTALVQARPAASFATVLTSGPHGASSSLLLDVSPLPGGDADAIPQPFFEPNSIPQSEPYNAADTETFHTPIIKSPTFNLAAPIVPPLTRTVRSLRPLHPVGCNNDEPATYEAAPQIS